MISQSEVYVEKTNTERKEYSSSQIIQMLWVAELVDVAVKYLGFE
jgi:hypothetical protein